MSDFRLVPHDQAQIVFAGSAAFCGWENPLTRLHLTQDLVVLSIHGDVTPEPEWGRTVMVDAVFAVTEIPLPIEITKPMLWSLVEGLSKAPDELTLMAEGLAAAAREQMGQCDDTP